MNDLYVIKKINTGTNSTEVHILSAASNYRDFSLHTGTPLGETGDNWCFLNGYHEELLFVDDGDGEPEEVIPLHKNGDVAGILQRQSGSGMTEVHILSAESNYQEFSVHMATALGMTGDIWEFGIDAANNLFAFLKGTPQQPTGSGFFEVHVLSFQSNYQEFVLQQPTPVPINNDSFVCLLGPNLDLFLIKRNNTGTHSTEVHVVSYESNYHDFILQQGTALPETDETVDFLVDSDRNILVIERGSQQLPTGSGFIEVHILSAQSLYKEFIAHLVTPLPMGDNDFAFSLSQNLNEFFDNPSPFPGD